MSELARRFALAAQACTGSPFRLHGRDRETGVDCIGLVLVALAECGIALPAFEGYGLRNTQLSRFARLAADSGLMRFTGAPVPGDILVFRPSPAQAHLAVVTVTGGLVHAHAGLRRVVTQSSPCAWPRLDQWRIGPELENSWLPSS